MPGGSGRAPQIVVSEALSTAIEKTRAADEGDDAQGLAAAVDELSALSYQMTEKLYSSLGGEAPE